MDFTTFPSLIAKKYASFIMLVYSYICMDIILTKDYWKIYVFFNTEYRITTGFFSENTIILAEGEMLLDNIFQVSAHFPFHLVFFFLF